VPEAEITGNLIEAYHRLLMNPDPAIHEKAARDSLVAVVQRVRIPIPRWGEFVPPYAIGTVAMFWIIQRVALF
jgi:hypothetical protein